MAKILEVDRIAIRIGELLQTPFVGQRFTIPGNFHSTLSGATKDQSLPISLYSFPIIAATKETSKLSFHFHSILIVADVDHFFSYNKECVPFVVECRYPALHLARDRRQIERPTDSEWSIAERRVVSEVELRR